MSDDTDEIQRIVVAGEPIPSGEHTISRTIEVPAGKRILSLNDHKPKQPPKSAHYATKDDVVAAMSTGFLAMGQKVYTQAMEQTVTMMTEQDEKHAGELAALRQELNQLRADAGL